MPAPTAITAIDVLNAYANGVFPMARSRRARTVGWVDPEYRGIIPLETFHTPKSLQKFVHKNPFTVTVNKNFAGMIQLCAEARAETWINTQIEKWMLELHQLGFAHSVECWAASGELAGGLYGVALRGAFFGESMASRQSGASKVALVHLVERLKQRGYKLLDTQFTNPHLLQFGCIEIPRDVYQSKLSEALSVDCSFV